MRERGKTLDQLGVPFGTDKSSIQLDDLTFYERYFAAWRDKPERTAMRSAISRAAGGRPLYGLGDALKFCRNERKNLDLSGFALGFADRGEGLFEAEAIGEFRGAFGGVVVALGGQDCVPPTGITRLCGMQIVIRRKTAAAALK
jgi:hypothetical protein